MTNWMRINAVVRGRKQGRKEKNSRTYTKRARREEQVNKVQRGVTREGHQSGTNGQKSIQAFSNDDCTACPICTSRLKSSDLGKTSEKR